MGLIYLVWNNLANLTTNRNVAYTCLLYCGSFKEPLWIEPNLVVKNDNEFALEPLLDVFFFLAGYTSKSLLGIVTHLKLDRQLLCFRRVIVTPDYEIFARDTLELLLPCFDF